MGEKYLQESDLLIWVKYIFSNLLKQIYMGHPGNPALTEIHISSAETSKPRARGAHPAKTFVSRAQRTFSDVAETPRIASFCNILHVCATRLDAKKLGFILGL